MNARQLKDSISVIRKQLADAGEQLNSLTEEIPDKDPVDEPLTQALRHIAAACSSLETAEEAVKDTAS